MNRIPPNLSYLTIYNPTLRPSVQVQGTGNSDDNEDAEEQAHILFYTSKERAVSRDRMLRQVGLAKALVNFAELFNSIDSCDNVHSQSKRLVMISPEPNFWIHAAIELAKTPRPVDSRSKSNSTTTSARAKPLDKAKGKDSASSVQYDYDEGSVHDGAVRAYILKGYERFKLTHGSFTSILKSLGQEALELQLERFWTVWAWSWDMEEGLQFGVELGPLLHPFFTSLMPLLNKFSELLSEESVPVVLTRQHVIPSARYNARGATSNGFYPPSLATHLQSMIPHPRTVDTSRSSDTLNTLASSVDTIRGKQGPDSSTGKANMDTNSVATAKISGHSKHDSGNFLGMNMDMKKWNWPGYLTFGKGSGVVKPPLDEDKAGLVTPTVGTLEPNTETAVPETTTKAVTQTLRVEVNVDADALDDAISSDSLSFAARNSPPGESGADDMPSYFQQGVNANVGEDDKSDTVSAPFSNQPPESEAEAEIEPPTLLEFSLTKLHISPFRDPTNTRRVSIHYLIRNELMLALINTRDLRLDVSEYEDFEDDSSDLEVATEKSMKLFDNLEAAIHEAGLKIETKPLPTATRILQTQDGYLMSTGHYALSSPGFVSTSSHLFNAKAILDNDPEITEVFSRGKNPQHWHIAKRGFTNSSSGDGESVLERSRELVFMEVFRKETSLTDVDNVLVGMVKKSGLVDNGL